MLQCMKLVNLADKYKMFPCMNFFSRVIFELILFVFQSMQELSWQKFLGEKCATQCSQVDSVLCNVFDLNKTSLCRYHIL